MIELEVEGVEEVQEAVDQIVRAAGGDWMVAMQTLGDNLARYASSISPVVTGSYAGSHRSVLSEKQVQVSVDPTARNFVTGQPVIRYAGAVEERHNIYERTWGQISRFAAQVDEQMYEEMGF